MSKRCSLLCRYVLGYRGNSGQLSYCAKGPRPAGARVVHVVSSSMTVGLLQRLMADKLCPSFSGEEFELQVRLLSPPPFSLHCPIFST